MTRSGQSEHEKWREQISNRREKQEGEGERQAKERFCERISHAAEMFSIMPERRREARGNALEGQLRNSCSRMPKRGEKIEEVEMVEGEEERREELSRGRSLRAKKSHATRGRRWKSIEEGDSIIESEEREGRTEERVSHVLSHMMKQGREEARGRKFCHPFLLNFLNRSLC